MVSRDLERRMWADACEMLERAERLQRQFFHVTRQEAAVPVWEPPVDLFESEGELWILVALPGVPSDQVQVVLKGGMVTVQGERRLPPGLAGAAVRRMEIPYGSFRRAIRLPAGQFGLGRRVVQDGCLILTLVKTG